MLSDANKRTSNSYYLRHKVLADFNLELGNLEDASSHLLRAQLTRKESEQKFLEQKLERCEAKSFV